MSFYSLLNLEKEPFSTSPDPGFFYQSFAHRTALQRLEITIRLRRGLSIILGDVGTGKTTLLRALLRQFHEDHDFIFHMILDPDFKTEYQFLSTLTRMFGISPFFRSTIDHKEAIERYLYQKGVEENKTVVLLIDEGQKLSQPLLEILRIFLNYETNEQKLLQLVILSQMELLPRIKRIPNFIDRINFKYIINPLNEEETRELIYYRLMQAGFHGRYALFTYEAVKKIYEITGGYPRKISHVCHNALEHLVMENREAVTGDLIDELYAQESAWRS